jgi:hypothetical protein
MSLLPPPRHIESALKRLFPTVRLEYSEALDVWVVTDCVYGNNGEPATYYSYKTPRKLYGIVNSDRTNRVVLAELRDPMTGEAVAPTREAIIDALLAGHTGARDDAIDEVVNRIDEQEDNAEYRQLQERRAAGREVAKSAYDAHVGKASFSGAAAITQKNVLRDMTKTLAARQRDMENAQVADAEVMARMREGWGISNQEKHTFGGA